MDGNTRCWWWKRWQEEEERRRTEAAAQLSKWQFMFISLDKNFEAGKFIAWHKKNGQVRPMQLTAASAKQFERKQMQPVLLIKFPFLQHKTWQFDILNKNYYSAGGGGSSSFFSSFSSPSFFSAFSVSTVNVSLSSADGTNPSFVSPPDLPPVHRKIWIRKQRSFSR